jgi:hypothetical protein
MVLMLLTLLLQQPQKPQTDVERLAALQLSTECRDAGDKFWQNGGYANRPGFMTDHLTHYNRQESKCFIRTAQTTNEPGKDKTMFMMIFDAVEGSLIASRLFKFDGTAYVTAYINDGGAHEHDPPTQADRAWFDNLMAR